MEQKGREIFLCQLESMDADGRIVDWLDEEEQKRYLELADEFQVPKDLRDAFTAYVREYAEGVGQSTRSDGVFYNEGNTNAGIYEKLDYFYSPLARVIEEDFPGIRVRAYIEPKRHDPSTVLIVAETVDQQCFVLPFVVFKEHIKAWDPFFDQFEPQAVYERLEKMREEAAGKAKLGMSLISLIPIEE
ncbi:MAG: hypothetical protein QMD10_07075 [Desulfitobacteriaceae bacterium]|nr:hypothetical protein [Desulfitobacteriaceae bacterium]